MRPPLLLIDVDGVLSLFGFAPEAPPAGRFVLVDGAPHLLSEVAAAQLRRLAATFECVWCTGWEERADEHLPHLLDLPSGWPHLAFRHSSELGHSTMGHWKLGAIEAYAGPDRPLAWIDDRLDEACWVWASNRPGRTLLVEIDPAVGLISDHADELERWASLCGA